jgi:putative inorganic carbon (hco3(-)) transporter
MTVKTTPTQQSQSAILLLLAFIAAALAVLLNPAAILITILSIGICLFFLKKPFVVLLSLVVFRAGIDLLARQHNLFDGTPYSINLLGILNIALVCLAIFYFLIIKQQIPNQPFWLVFSAFLYIALISILVSGNRILSLRGLMQVGSYLAIYLLLASQLKSLQSLNQLRLALLSSAIVPLLFGLYQFLTVTGNTVISPGLNRIMGTFFHPSAFGMYLVIIWPLAFLQWQQSKMSLRRALSFVLLVTITFCLAMTFTRIVWVALVLNLFGVLFVFRRFRLMFFMLIVGAIIAVVAWQPIAIRFGEAVKFENGSLVFSEWGSVAWRFQQWQIAIELFMERPLTGVGWWTFPDYNIWRSTPHNDYLRIAAETGVFGLLLFIFLILYVTGRLWLAYRGMPLRSNLKQQVGIVLLSICTYVVLSLTDNPLGQPEVSWYLWAMIALGVGSVRLSPRSRYKDYDSP